MAGLRFRLRQLLIVMALFGAAFAVLFAAPDHSAVPLLALLSMALPAVLAAGILYSEGNLRAFCLGALFPATSVYIGLSLIIGFFMYGAFPGGVEVVDWSTLHGFSERFAFPFRFWTGLGWIVSLLVGSVVVLFRMAGKVTAPGRTNARNKCCVP